MKTFLKLKHTSFAALLVAMLTITSAVAANTDLVSASDAQHFEQTYEEWTKSILKSINPKIEFTVLSQVEFTRNPERIQDYEDIKAANHLPGLPEMSDPNYSNPLDSPLYALVAKRNFKIIFYSALSTSETEVIREVLNSKLRIGSDDSLNFEFVDRELTQSPKQVSNGNPAGLGANLTQKKLAIAALAGGVLMIFGAVVSFRRRKPVMEASPKEKQFNEELKSSLTPPVTHPMIAPTHQIQMASHQALKRVLANEKAELIARASLNATKKFSNYILGECEQNKFDLVMQWINANHKSVSHQDSNYARLLLAARLQQVQNESVLSSIEAFNQARNAKLQLLAKKPLYTVAERKEVDEAKL